MAYTAAPRISLPLTVTEEEYTQAALFVSRRCGMLRSLPLVVALAMLLLLVGLGSLSWFSATFFSLLIPFLFCMTAVLLLILIFRVEPARVKKQAREQYATFSQLLQPATLQLFADNAVTHTPTLTLTDPYALLPECIETPTLFIFIKDNERRLILPKRCILAEEQEQVYEFLRLCFTRKRRLMKHWFW